MTDIGVTFDTCSLDIIVKNRPGGREVRDAIEAGRVRGFYCETLVTLEGVRRKERPQVLGRTRPVSRSSPTGKHTINIEIGIEYHRPPLDPTLLKVIQIIEAMGMRALRGPARMCGVRAKHGQVKFFEPHESVLELAKCMDKVNELATAIGARGLGYAVPVTLGLQLLTPEEIAKPTLWFEGLRRATGHKRVARAVNEWADGDSVAAHYGYGIDLFCTEDRGRNARGSSVFDDANKAWLQKDYGIEFVSVVELSEKLG
ncbi:MAG: hypothetical protein WB760_33010 [Xanthobacteraceae bacterium]